MKTPIRFILSLDNKKIFLVLLIFNLIFTSVFCTWAKTYSFHTQNNIANEVVRFHVLANSDSNFDQALKLKVRNAVLTSMHNELSVSKNKSQTLLILLAGQKKIADTAQKIIVQNGCDYPVKILLSNDFFPTKKYGDIKFPAGMYDTLKIIIGSGKGHNWWCVMFPPLCFFDVATKKSIPQNLKSELKNILSDDEFQLINSENTKRIPIKIKFKIIEVYQTFRVKAEKSSSRFFCKKI